MFAGNNQKMDRRLWINVAEDENILLFMDKFRRNFLVDDFAKYAV